MHEVRGSVFRVGGKNGEEGRGEGGDSSRFSKFIVFFSLHIFSFFFPFRRQEEGLNGGRKGLEMFFLFLPLSPPPLPLLDPG